MTILLKKYSALYFAYQALTILDEDHRDSFRVNAVKHLDSFFQKISPHCVNELNKYVEDVTHQNQVNAETVLNNVSFKMKLKQ